MSLLVANFSPLRICHVFLNLVKKSFADIIPQKLKSFSKSSNLNRSQILKMKHLLFYIVFVFLLFSVAQTKKPEEKPEWAKKDIRDYSDADMERLLDQWDEDEEPLEPDELPEHLRPAPKIDFSNLKDPEAMLRASKRGKSLMTFVTVSGEPSRDETEKITQIWQTSLLNAHIQAERYVIDNNRAIFMYKDGAQAWDAKDYLIEQDRCYEVTIEQKQYHGVGYKPREGNVEKLRSKPVKSEL